MHSYKIKWLTVPLVSPGRRIRVLLFSCNSWRSGSRSASSHRRDSGFTGSSRTLFTQNSFPFLIAFYFLYHLVLFGWFIGQRWERMGLDGVVWGWSKRCRLGWDGIGCAVNNWLFIMLFFLLSRQINTIWCIKNL